MITKKECKQMLIKHYQKIDNEYKNTGVLSKNSQYRIDHSIAVAKIAKKIIKNNPELFPDKKMNKWFIRACLLHDIFKLDKFDGRHEHHAEHTGLYLMALGFPHEISLVISLHSAVKEYDFTDTIGGISNYLFLLQDVDIISKYNIEFLIKSHDGVEDTIECIKKLLDSKRLNGALYFDESVVILHDGIKDMLKYLKYHSKNNDGILSEMFKSIVVKL